MQLVSDLIEFTVTLNKLAKLKNRFLFCTLTFCSVLENLTKTYI